MATNAKAISTYKTYLMVSENGSTYSKLIDIKEFPDLGGEPEMLETTTLSDKMQTYIAGIQSMDALTFTANYTKDGYKSLVAYMDQNDHKFAVYFGADGSGNPDGSDGKFVFDGQLSVYVNGGGVNEVTNMTISIAPSTEVEFKDE